MAITADLTGFAAECGLKMVTRLGAKLKNIDHISGSAVPSGEA